MVGYKFPFVLAFGLLAQSTAPVFATSIATAAPHNPNTACENVAQLVDNLNAGTPWGSDERNIVFFYSDRFGEVERDERDAFTKHMRHSNGKRDRRNMKVASLHSLHEDERWPQYIVKLDRAVWKLTSWETDGMLMEREIDDPHWTTDFSTWLVQFRNNRIHSVREARELVSLVSNLERVKGC